MNAKTKNILIWSAVAVGVAGVSLLIIKLLNKKPKKSDSAESSVDNSNSDNNTDVNSGSSSPSIPSSPNTSMSASTNNGLIVINKGGTKYNYQLQGYAFFKWWDISVNSINLSAKKVTYTNPSSGAVSTESLADWVIKDITNNLGSSIIDMGTTDDGKKIKLTKV